MYVTIIKYIGRQSWNLVVHIRLEHKFYSQTQKTRLLPTCLCVKFLCNLPSSKIHFLFIHVFLSSVCMFKEHQCIDIASQRLYLSQMSPIIVSPEVYHLLWTFCFSSCDAVWLISNLDGFFSLRKSFRFQIHRSLANYIHSNWKSSTFTCC